MNTSSIKELGERIAARITSENELFCVANKNGYFELVTESWTKVLGWTREELLCNPWLEFVHKDDRPATIAVAEQMYKEDITKFENRYQCRDGTFKWLRWTALKFNGSGTALAVAREITDKAKGQTTDDYGTAA